jgi:hypothetical protein
MERLGGRQKGTENKLTKETRLLINSIVQDNLSRFQKDLDSLPPRDRVNAILQLLKFNLPTLKAVEVTSDTSISNNITPVIIQFNEERN